MVDISKTTETFAMLLHFFLSLGVSIFSMFSVFFKFKRGVRAKRQANSTILVLNKSTVCKQRWLGKLFSSDVAQQTAHQLSRKTARVYFLDYCDVTRFSVWVQILFLN